MCADVYLDEAEEEEASPVCCVLRAAQTVPSLAQSSSQSARVGKNAMGGEKPALGLAPSLLVFLQL